MIAGIIKANVIIIHWQEVVEQKIGEDTNNCRFLFTHTYTHTHTHTHIHKHTHTQTHTYKLLQKYFGNFLCYEFKYFVLYKEVKQTPKKQHIFIQTGVL